MTMTPEIQRQLADTLNAITDKKDPETRKTVLRAIQKKDPTAVFPELQQDDLTQSIERRFEELNHAQAARDTQSRLEAQRGELMARGYSEEDVKKIETDVMQKHGISDYKVAAVVFDAEQPAPAPSYDIRGKRPWKAESLKRFMENPRDTAREVASEIVHEMRASTQPNFNRRSA